MLDQCDFGSSPLAASILKPPIAKIFDDLLRSEPEGAGTADRESNPVAVSKKGLALHSDRAVLPKAPTWLADNGVFYATYRRSAAPADNPGLSHDHEVFDYTQCEMCAFGEANGFTARYIGDWGHPRGQVMVEYRIS